MLRNKLGKSFVTIMIVIAASALFLRLSIDKLIKFNIAQNESGAQNSLKLISAAIENYARDNKGIYPSSLAMLLQSKPPYLSKDFISQSPLKGYSYSCPRIEASGYSCYANPAKCGLTGNTVYTVTTSGLLISEPCAKEE